MPVLHRDDRVERLAEAEVRQRLTVRGDVSPARHRRLLLGAIGGAKLDELGRLIGVDVTLRTDQRRHQPRPIATAHDEVGDLRPRLHLGKGEDVGGMPIDVALTVGGGATGIGERGGDRRRRAVGGMLRHRGGGQDGGCGEGRDESHGISPGSVAP